MSAKDMVNPAKRHENYRRFGGYKSLAEADAQLRAYWQSRTPEERKWVPHNRILSLSLRIATLSFLAMPPTLSPEQTTHQWNMRLCTTAFILFS